MKKAETVTSEVDPAFATGALLRRYMDSTMGDLTTQDASVFATSVAADPRALGSLLGLDEAQAQTIDPFELRSRLMQTYFAQRFAQDLAFTVDETAEEGASELQSRLSRYASASGARVEQADEAMRQAAEGDCSALNRMEEIYFFE